MLRKSYLISLFLFFCLSSIAQNASVKGLLIDEEHNTIITNAHISLEGTTFIDSADNKGSFILKNVPYGIYKLIINAGTFLDYTKEISIEKPTVDLGTINLQHSVERETISEIPSVELTESDLKDNSSQSVASSLGASRDAFLSAASFTFSVAHFRIRGYDAENEVTLMNGSPMDNLTSGRTMYFTWTGLNDVMRSREATLGLSPANYSFGGVGGSYSIDSRATHQRKQFQVSYAIGNRSYDNRVMATYGTGLLKGGWSAAASFSRRWADEGYVKGTYYDGWSYFASIEKIINNRHFISLTGFGAPTINGKQAPAVQEMYDLAGSNYYNPDWGYQQGKVRNVSVGNSNLPTAIITWEWKLNDKTNLETAISGVTGKSKSSGFDWFNAPDPRPDFYRKLPSFINDSLTSAQAAELLRNNESMRQIRWDELYQSNYLSNDTIINVDGIDGKTVTGHRSNYIVQDVVTEINKFNFNTTCNYLLNNNVVLSGGLSYQTQTSESYKVVKDLLGGDFYVDWNQYTEQDFPGDSNALQNDLNHPNRILRVGDKFGYDYEAHISKTNFWVQPQFKFDKVDFFVALNFSNTNFYRDGKTRPGIFAGNSYGNSAKENFTNYGFKGGVTYKINGRNYIFANAGTFSRAPYFEDSYISVRTRNTLAPDLKNENIASVEGGYILNAPRIRAKVTGYFTEFNNGTNTLSFYHGDARTFVNYTLTNIDKTHSGIEISGEGNIGHGFSLNTAASIGQYIYTSRMSGTITQDNLDTVLRNETIYSKNFYAGGPQAAYTVGVTYRSPKFWFVNIDFNYFDKIWIDFNPARRTQIAVDLVDPNSENWKNIIDQQQVKGQFTMDFSGGYSYKLNNKFKSLKRQTFIVFNAGIHNLLNNRDFITNGYEQLRFDFTDKNVNEFAPKYFYAYGTTFFINLTLRFN